MEPGNFNSNLSAIIWVVQLLIFYHGALEEQQGYGETLKIVKAYCDEYLQRSRRQWERFLDGVCCCLGS
jgi:hypothetical protein